MSVDFDKDGHFPGCYAYGCAATLCAEARLLAEYGRRERALRERQNQLPSRNQDALKEKPLDWEQRAIARAAEVLLNEGARDVAIELLTYTRRR